MEVGVGVLVGNGMFDAGIASDTEVLVGDGVGVGGSGARVGAKPVAGVLVGIAEGEGTGVESGAGSARHADRRHKGEAQPYDRQFHYRCPV